MIRELRCQFLACCLQNSHHHLFITAHTHLIKARNVLTKWFSALRDRNGGHPLFDNDVSWLLQAIALCFSKLPHLLQWDARMVGDEYG